MTPRDHFTIKSILSLGRHMGRDRYQEGSLVIIGKCVKKWRGHFYVYEKQADGSEKRRFRMFSLASSPKWTKGRPNKNCAI